MLRITVPATEMYDSKRGEFISTKEQTLQLEHSLVSLSKWESRWNKPFISRTDITYEETIDYIRCMTITQNVDPMIYDCLTNENINQVNEYIGRSMTATTFSGDTNKKGGSRDIITAEIIYHWMIALQIPNEYRKWHLNSLLTLIRVCNEKNQPPKKMSQQDIMRRNAQLNAARRKKHNSKG